MFISRYLKKTNTNLVSVELEDVGRPKNTVKETEGKIDEHGRCTGLPPHIQTLLEAAGISKNLLKRNFREALYVASLHFDNELEKLFSRNKVLRGRGSFQRIMDGAVEIKHTNPVKSYHYGKKDVLGTGGFGSVFKCTKRTTNEDFALKIAPLSERRQVENEIKMHALSENHPNIVGLHDAFLWNEKIYMVVELMKCGCLYEYIRLPPTNRWSEKAVVYVLREVLKGLAFMHANHHLHRDIKSQNILFSAKGDVKIADFGFAIGLTKEESARETRLGTPCWMAPEVILKRRYNSKVDVWALGITLLEITDGYPPYAGMDQLKTLFLIRTNDPPTFRTEKYWSQELKHFLSLCLKKNPAERATSQDLLMHPALSEEKICDKEDLPVFLKSTKKAVLKYREQRKAARRAAAAQQKS